MSAVQELAETLADIQRQLDELRRASHTAQLPDSSLRPGQSIKIVDEDEQPVGSIGYQADGGVGLVVAGGDPPPVPSTPDVEPSISGVMVSWDAEMAEDGAEMPSDFDHVDVHVDLVTDFDPDGSTRVGTIPRAGGQCPISPLDTGVEHFVRLVGVTTGGVEGEPSATASATPTTVVEGVGPGEITETLIADDSISTPKLRASAVEADKIAVNAVTAGKILAGAITADKLAAILVLASRIIAGTDGADRTEIDDDGIRGYNDAGELIFAVQNGNAYLSGNIFGSLIEGSEFLVGDLSGDHIRIGESDPSEGTGWVLTARGGGSRVNIRAHGDAAEIRLTPPPSSGGELFFDGFQYAYLATGSGWVYPAVAYSSPYTENVLPAGARTELTMEGQSETVDATRMRHYADVHQFDLGVRTAYARGVLEIAPELSVRAPAHAPATALLLAQPTGSGNNSVWTDFTTGQYQRLTFRTGYSGRVIVLITMCGINTSTGGATLSTGFRLTSPTAAAVPASLARAAMVRSRQFAGTTNTYGEQQQIAVPLQLDANTEYTLIPAWRASGALAVWGTDGDSPLKLDMGYDNSIAVTNQM